MIKKILLAVVFIGIAGALVFGAIQRTNAQVGNEGFSNESRGQGGRRSAWAATELEPAGLAQGVAEHDAPQADLPAVHQDPVVSAAAVQAGALTQEEIDGLLYMREEEKLARDVYLALYELWGQQTFQNIAGSEQTHMDSVLTLLEGYGVADPAAGAANGVFANADLQALYDQLIAQGSQSLTDALKVGAAIEEIDILDLRIRAGQTEEEAILAVYASLESGSVNHLRAFTSTLARRSGETYQAQYLSAEDYQAIVSTANGNGGRRGNW